MLKDITGHPPDPRSIVTHPDVCFNSYVGVEVELEDVWFTKKDVENDTAFWKWTQDGSLRGNAAELVFSVPLGGADIVEALEELEDFVDNPTVSERCGLHVHLDVRDLDELHLCKLAFLCATIEPVLYEYCGIERENSIFCLPLEESMWGLTTLVRSTKKVWENKCLTNRDVCVGSLNEFPRYSGTNFSSVTKYGTVEFRMHYGAYHAQPILNWINILLCLKRCAIQEPFSIESFPEYVSRIGPEQVFDRIWPDKTGELLRNILSQGRGEYILDGLRRSQELAVSDALESVMTNVRLGRLPGDNEEELF